MEPAREQAVEKNIEAVKTKTNNFVLFIVSPFTGYNFFYLLPDLFLYSRFHGAVLFDSGQDYPL
jgi:hypothetical protein